MQGKWLLSSQLCSPLNHTVWSGCISSPTGSRAKAYIWQAFKPQLQNMCWRKWFKILRKQSFILEKLFTWDNKLLPRIGSIHQENTTTQHTLAEYAFQPSRCCDYYLHLSASKMEKQAGHTSMRAAELSRVVTPPYPGEASKIQVTSWTQETYLASTQTDTKALAGTWAHEGDGRQKRPGPGPRLPTSPLKR